MNLFYLDKIKSSKRLVWCILENVYNKIYKPIVETLVNPLNKRKQYIFRKLFIIRLTLLYVNTFRLQKNNRNIRVYQAHV